MERSMIDTARSLFALVYANWEELNRCAANSNGHLYCPRCGANRRVELRMSHDWVYGRPDGKAKGLRPTSPEGFAPCLFLANCVECRAEFTLLLYISPTGPSLAILSPHYGGVSTPNTPAPVNYFLDQAHRAHSVGAATAAIAMYRSALEQLLLDQGYEQKMCGPKIKALLADIENGNAPDWTGNLDPEFLTVITELGNAAIHPLPEDADPQQQAESHAQLISAVNETFAMLLEEAYEAPKKHKARLEALKKHLPANK